MFLRASSHEASQPQSQRQSLPRSSLLALVIAACVVAPLSGNSQTVWGQSPDGSQVTELAPSRSRVLVLFFVATDCPISNRSFPEMKRLREKYTPQEAAFWYVYPNDDETPQAVEDHQRSFDAHGISMLAHGPDIVRLAHVYATPEVAILKRAPRTGWQTIYAGPIDNRYVKFGLERSRATEHYADDAIAAAIAGRKPMPATGNIVGCAIMNSGARP